MMSSYFPVSTSIFQTPPKCESAERMKLSVRRRYVMPLSKPGTSHTSLMIGGVKMVPLGRMRKGRMSTEYTVNNVLPFAVAFSPDT